LFDWITENLIASYSQYISIGRQKIQRCGELIYTLYNFSSRVFLFSFVWCGKTCIVQVISDGDPDPLWKLILIHISGSILILIRHFLSVLKISKTFVFFLRTSGEYLKKYRKESVFNTDPWKQILKTDPCPYLVKYSL
jgi:hypothetical protein